jgi:hypothetical protein
MKRLNFIPMSTFRRNSIFVVRSGSWRRSEGWSWSGSRSLSKSWPWSFSGSLSWSWSLSWSLNRRGLNGNII